LFLWRCAVPIGAELKLNHHHTISSCLLPMLS
jgi:hypothetical protein